MNLQRLMQGRAWTACLRPSQVFVVIWGVSLLYVFAFVWMPLCGYYGARYFLPAPLFVYAMYLALEAAARIAFTIDPESYSKERDSTALRAVSVLGIFVAVRRTHTAAPHLTTALTWLASRGTGVYSFAGREVRLSSRQDERTRYADGDAVSLHTKITC